MINYELVIYDKVLVYIISIYILFITLEVIYIALHSVFGMTTYLVNICQLCQVK